MLIARAGTCRGPYLRTRSGSSEAVSRPTLGGTHSCSASNSCSCRHSPNATAYMDSQRTFPPSCRSRSGKSDSRRGRPGLLPHAGVLSRGKELHRRPGIQRAARARLRHGGQPQRFPAIARKATRSRLTSPITSSSAPLIGRPAVAGLFVGTRKADRNVRCFLDGMAKTARRVQTEPKVSSTPPFSLRRAIGLFGGIIRRRRLSEPVSYFEGLAKSVWASGGSTAARASPT